MGSDIAVLMPSLRSWTWDGIRDNLAKSSPNATLYPLGSEYASYAEAINKGYKLTEEPWIFLGADDLVFWEGWAEAALAEDGQVIGTNDLHNPYVIQGLHATHSLVSRDYIETVGGVIDQGPGTVLYGYDHQFTDAEFVETAIHRGVFAFAFDSKVEHLHPDFQTREPDAVDERTHSRIREDYDLFISRRHLWGGGSLSYLPPV